eukprot:COSAG02_NODE_293_length_25438_cov_52.630254_20_plen_74_part_00
MYPCQLTMTEARWVSRDTVAWRDIGVHLALPEGYSMYGFASHRWRQGGGVERCMHAHAEPTTLRLKTSQALCT